MSSINNEEVIKGVNLIWNNKFLDAEELFAVNRETNPRYALHYAESIFLRSFITADTEDTAGAMTRLKLAKELAESHMKALEKGMDPVDPLKKLADETDVLNQLLDARIVFGESLYMIAILQMTRDAKIKGAFNLRKSWKIFERALKECKIAKEKKGQTVDTEIQRCLQFGAGFFLFAISIIPAKFLKLVELAGFKADREAGLHYMRECHQNGGIRGPFSTMVLLFNDLLLPRGLANAEEYLVEAEDLIKQSLAKYPEGSLFQVMGSHCARKRCDVQKGIELMEIALNNCQHFKQPPLIYRYELANCYCMELKWEKAASLYLPLLDEQRFQVRLFCHLQLGCCYMMMDQKDKATAVWNKALGITSKKGAPYDSVVLRQIKRYLSNGGYFSAFELMYLRRDLAKMVPIMTEVLKALHDTALRAKATDPYKSPVPVKQEKASKGFSFGGLKNLAANTVNSMKKKDVADYTADDRASYLLLKGTMLKALNKSEEANDAFKELLSFQEFITEKLYVPYTLYELGESYYFQGNTKDAEEIMHKCGKINGYDWEDPLKIRLKVTSDQLKKKNKTGNETYSPIDSMVTDSPLPVHDEKEEEEPSSDDDLEDDKKVPSEENSDSDI